MKNLKKRFIFILVAAVIASSMMLSSSALSVIRIKSNQGDTTSCNTDTAAANTSNTDCNSSLDVNSVLSQFKSLCSDAANNTASNSTNPADIISDSSLPDNVQSYLKSVLQNINCNTTGKTDTSVDAASDKPSADTTVSDTASDKDCTTSDCNAGKCGTVCNANGCNTGADCNAGKCDAANNCNTGNCNTGNCASSDNQCNTIPNICTGSNGSLSNCINSILGKFGIKQSGCPSNTTSTPSQPTSSKPDSTSSTPSSNGGSSSSTPSGNNSSSQPSSSNNNSSSGSSSSNQNADNLSFEERVVALVNEQRAANGLAPLTLNKELSKVARAKSQDMHDKRYFSHTSPTYGSPFDMMRSFGISYRTAGENIAMGYATPEAVMNGWMNSPGHRANILNSAYTQIGVGYVADGNYWTQHFIG